MLYRTVVPTEIHSGFKSNVIPSEARIGIDVRTHAHEGIDGIVSELTRRMNLGGAATISVDMYTKGYEIPVHREEIKTLRTTILNEWSNVLPTLTVTPYLLPASSDSSHYAEAGITPIGFAPLLFPIDFPGFSLAHGVDERVPKSSFENGLLLYLIALDSLSESR